MGGGEEAAGGEGLGFGGLYLWCGRGGGGGASGGFGASTIPPWAAYSTLTRLSHSSLPPHCNSKQSNGGRRGPRNGGGGGGGGGRRRG